MSLQSKSPQQPNSRKFPRRRAEWIFLSTVFFTKIPLEPPLRRKLGRPAPRLCDLGLLICRSASRGTDLHRPNVTRLRISRSRGPHQVVRLLLDSGLGVKPAWKRSAQTTYSIISAVIPSHKKQSPRTHHQSAAMPNRALSSLSILIIRNAFVQSQRSSSSSYMPS